MAAALGPGAPAPRRRRGRAAAQARAPGPGGCRVSVVVPLYDEEENVGPLVAAVEGALGGRPGAAPGAAGYELLLVDDGSRDGTWSRIEAAAAAAAAGGGGRVAGLKLRRNCGQTAALRAGFAAAAGEVLVTMDGDLQNDPRDIPALLDALDGEGAGGAPVDMVCGWRADRRDGFLRTVPSYLANRLIRALTRVPIHDSGCGLKAFRRWVPASVDLRGERHRYLPLLAALSGATLRELRVRHRPRAFGASKYSALGRAPRVVLDLLAILFAAKFGDRPVQALGGAALALLGGGALAPPVLGWLGRGPPSTWALASLACVLCGAQLLALGLLGELLAAARGAGLGGAAAVERRTGAEVGRGLGAGGGAGMPEGKRERDE